MLEILAVVVIGAVMFFGAVAIVGWITEERGDRDR